MKIHIANLTSVIILSLIVGILIGILIESTNKDLYEFKINENDFKCLEHNLCIKDNTLYTPRMVEVK